MIEIIVGILLVLGLIDVVFLVSACMLSSQISREEERDV